MDRADVSQQLAYLAQIEPLLRADSRIRAAWLGGSFGRGNADHYADIDLHVLVAPAAIAEVRTALDAALAALRPLVLTRRLFNNRMFNGLTADGLRLDLWLHDDAPVLDKRKVRVLIDRGKSLRFDATSALPDAATRNARIAQQIAEFWRCIALLPAVIGRQELIVSQQGLTVEVNVLTDVIILGEEIERDSGVKRLNPFLPDDQRQAIEAALALDGLTPQSLVNAHLALARIMQRTGRAIAARHGIDYPTDVENAALTYVERELAPLGLVEQQVTNGNV